MAEKIIGRGYITIADLKDGESARTFVLVPSVESVTKKLDGSLSEAEVSCAVYKVTGSSAYALSSEHTLSYLRTPDGAKGELAHSNGVSEVVEILATTESVEFELNDGKSVIDRIRIPVLSDATDVGDALDKYKYLKAALQDGTTITGGLLLTKLISLGENNTDYTTQKVWSGISGVFDTDKQGKSIAVWYGGDMVDMADYYDWNEDTHKWVLKAGADITGLRLAQGLDRMDGTGYRAGGNLWWDESGNVHADPLSFFVGEEAVGNVAALFKFYPYNNAEFSKTTAVEPTRVFTRLRIGSQNGMDYIELAYENGNLKVGGNIISNGDVIALNQGSAEGGSGSGSGGIDLAALEAYLKAQKYATQSWVTSQGYLTAITKAQVESVLTGAIASHTHAFASLTSKPTTLNGYGITDAYTQAEINAKLTNGSVTKIGTASVGSSTKPIYLSSGVPTASSSTVGGAAKPMWLNAGTLTACSSTIGYSNLPVYLNAGTITKVTSIAEGYLSWGGKATSGTVTPLDCACVPFLSANRIAFSNPDGITIEYSRDGGETWLDYEATSEQKTTLVSGFMTKTPFKIGKFVSASTGAVTTDFMLRVILDGYKMGVDFMAVKMLLETSSNGSKGGKVLYEYSNGNALDTYTTRGTYSLSGWPGWSSIPFGGYRFGGAYHSTRVARVRLTFSIDELQTSGNNGLALYSIVLISQNSYTWPSTLAKTGHLYLYDESQNATFPAKVTATAFIGNIGTDTIGSSTKPIYLNAGKPTASSSTIGGSSKPIYLNAGTLTASTASIGGAAKPIYMSSGTLTAMTGTIGSASKPMYMNGGTLTACSYTFGNASGNAALNNGTLNTNLNADLLDGKHAGTANGNVAIYVSFPSASTLKSGGYLDDSFVASASNANELYFKALCCWSIDNYPSGGILQGRVNPNALGYCVLHLYANGKDATTGLPQHCSGMYLSLLQAVETFGTYDYAWRWGEMNVPKLKIGDCVIAWSDTNKALEFSQSITSKGDVVAYK